MSRDDGISTRLIGYGIPVGALMGILASFLSEVNLSHAFSFGVAGGILTAAFIATTLRKKEIEISYFSLTTLGLVFGTLVGISIGLLMAWSLGEQYMGGFSVGAGVGLLGGAVLGILASFFSGK